jgi:3-deoxy-D-manno-octulosonate 8-phosphate phosphatase (KDO 8-P phosphatase)
MDEIAEVERRAARVKLLLMDCDGVLTDGRLTLLENGDEQKSFHTRDGHGLVLFHRAGLRSGIISGRTSSAVERRARELGIAYVRQGALDKIKDFEQVLAEARVEEAETAFVGDDVTDIPLMQRTVLAVAVADANEETRAAAHYVTKLPGGYGAVREVAELILKAQGHWEELMRRYSSSQ